MTGLTSRPSSASRMILETECSVEAIPKRFIVLTASVFDMFIAALRYGSHEPSWLQETGAIPVVLRGVPLRIGRRREPGSGRASASKRRSAWRISASGGARDGRASRTRRREFDGHRSQRVQRKRRTHLHEAVLRTVRGEKQCTNVSALPAKRRIGW